jgi:uncharacterized protein YceK
MMPFILMILFSVMIGCSSVVSTASYNYCIGNSQTVDIAKQCQGDESLQDGDKK